MYELIIVEDESGIRDGLAYLLPWENLRFQLAGAFAGGEEALAFLRDHPVDVILTDIRMGGLDGIALAREARCMMPEVQIVFLTGYRDFEYAHQAIKCGVHEFLLKPVKYEEMVITFLNIRAALDEKKPSAAQEALKRGSEGYYDRLIAQAKKHVDENLRTATLESASIAANLSTSYFSRLFKEREGENFADYSMRRRMELARRLLLDNDRRTYEIAYAAGYDNPKNFTRAFKKYFGVTPREFREGTAPSRREEP